MKSSQSKLTYLMALLTFCGLVTQTAWAKPSSPAKSQKSATSDKKKQAPKGNFKSEHTFDNAYVQGQYQIGDGGLAVVEDEKNLDDLLGMRFEFKDRLRKQLR
jgi:hypothetical protein